MSSLNTLRLPDGTQLSISEWLHYPIFSTIEIAQGDGINLAAFSYVQSQPVSSTATIAQRNATPADTNLIRRKAMNQDEALVVYSIVHEPIGLTTVADPNSAQRVLAGAPMMFGTDLRVLQQDCTVELIVGAGIKKPQVSGPYSYFPQSVGAPAYQSGDPGAAANLFTNYGTAGSITPRNQRMLNIPVYIGGTGQNAQPGNSRFFQLKFKAPGGPPALTANSQYRIRWYLDGLKKRPA